MSKYTVVITPVVDEGNDAVGHTQAIILVETSAPTPRITEVTIRSTASGGITSDALPSIDLEGVARALTSGVRSAPPSMPSTNLTREPIETTGRPEADSVTAGVSSAEKQPPHTNTAEENEPPTQVPPNAAERAYRRMPDADEVRLVHRRMGTVVGLAKHYGVPRHTAQGWMTRIRRLDDPAADSSPQNTSSES